MSTSWNKTNKDMLLEYNKENTFDLRILETKIKVLGLSICVCIKEVQQRMLFYAKFHHHCRDKASRFLYQTLFSLLDIWHDLMCFSLWACSCCNLWWLYSSPSITRWFNLDTDMLISHFSSPLTCCLWRRRAAQIDARQLCISGEPGEMQLCGPDILVYVHRWHHVSICNLHQAR